MEEIKEKSPQFFPETVRVLFHVPYSQ